MESRRIQSVGKGSYSISLPKGWIIHNHLREKDLVFIENINNNLIISTRNFSSNKNAISVNYKEIKNLKEFIRMCYIKGVNRIKINFVNKTERESESIRDILGRFNGYDISNEDAQSIEISFLFKDVDIDLEKIMRREIYLINLMLEQLKKKNFEELKKLENSVDSLNNLSKKILFMCLENKTLSKDNQIKDSYLIYTYLELIRRLERVADCIFSLMEEDYSHVDLKNLGGIISFLDNVVKIKKEESEELNKYVFNSNNRNVDIILKKLQHNFESIRDILEVLEMDKSFF
ncbi:Uncharacterised protein [uncultured archaeon]|nr:Uncharacterised protein [uncultured archaeon]